MTNFLTTEEWKERLYNKFPNLTIDILGEYTGSQNHIDCRCKICGNEWSPIANSLMQGNKCKKCAVFKTAQMKTLTHNKFIEKLKTTNSNYNTINILEKYTGSRNHISCECKICGYKWDTLPSVLLQGSGCSKCASKRASQKRTVTHNEFIEKLKTTNCHYNTINILGKYTGIFDTITCECKICGYKWDALPSVLLRGSGCSKCANKRVSQRRTLTHDEFIEKLKTTNCHYNTINILGEYTGYRNRISCECKICGNKWNPLAGTLLQGSGCSNCARVEVSKIKMRSYENFMYDFEQKNSHFKNIKILGDYKGVDNPIFCECKICGNKWSPRAGNLLRGQGCKKCAINETAKKITFTHNQFIKNLKTRNPLAKDINILNEYKGSLELISCECKICGYKWNPRAYALIRGSGCPNCNSSKGNKLLEDILIKNNFNHKKEISFEELKQRRFDNSVLNQFDIVKCLFEYDGSQHFETNDYYGGNDEFERCKQSDNIKNTFCINSNIPLLRIPYIYDAVKDADKIEKIILNFIETNKVPKDILDFYRQYDFSNYVDCVNEIEKKRLKNIV